MITLIFLPALNRVNVYLILLYQIGTGPIWDANSKDGTDPLTLASHPRASRMSTRNRIEAWHVVGRASPSKHKWKIPQSAPRRRRAGSPPGKSWSVASDARACCWRDNMCYSSLRPVAASDIPRCCGVPWQTWTSRLRRLLNAEPLWRNSRRPRGSPVSVMVVTEAGLCPPDNAGRGAVCQCS